jgi:hypothetical protein
VGAFGVCTDVSRKGETIVFGGGRVTIFGPKYRTLSDVKCFRLWQVIEVDSDHSEVLVHFIGWNERHDEWIKMDSPRLQQANRNPR